MSGQETMMRILIGFVWGVLISTVACWRLGRERGTSPSVGCGGTFLTAFILAGLGRLSANRFPGIATDNQSLVPIIVGVVGGMWAVEILAKKRKPKP